MIHNSTGLDMSYRGSSAQGLDGMGSRSLLVLNVWWIKLGVGQGLWLQGSIKCLGAAMEYKVETHGAILVFNIQAVEHKLNQWLGVGEQGLAPV